MEKKLSSAEIGATKRLKVAVVGARGYTGLDLCRILLRHPEAELAACFGSSTQEGAQFALSDYLPEETARAVPVYPVSEILTHAPSLKAVFLATPAETSAELAPKLLAAGVDVIDLSGAFRLKGRDLTDRAMLYAEWYSMKDHPSLPLLDDALFGLSPWAGPASPVGAGPATKCGSKGRLVSNPGCYATAILMGTLPLLKAGIIEPNSLVIDAKSGTSGAGRKASESSLFTEVDGECLPYKVAKHQHYPEICEHAQLLSGVAIDPMFTTSLIPVRRGIIAGLYARLKPGVTPAQVEAAFASAYEGYPLVRVANLKTGGKAAQSLLSLKRVAGSARTHISYTVDGSKLYVYSCIDNLLKGAASQAVENFNRLQHLPVATALTELEGTL